MEDRHLTETLISSQELLRGNILHALRDTVRLPDGDQATREYVCHPGGVMLQNVQSGAWTLAWQQG